METMRKMTSKLAASVLAVLLATAVMLWLPALTQAKAAEVRQPDEIENFDGDSLGARWEKAGDAEMNAGKSVLRFNRPNVWQPTVKPINYKAEETADTASYSLSIDYEILDGSGWMGIAFGMTAQTGHFYEAGIMFMITQSGGVSVWKGNAARNGLEAVDALAFSVPAPAAGVVYTYRIDAVKRAGTEPANRYYDFEFYAGVKGGLLQKAGTAADFVGSNHFGFASMGSLLAEISRVDFEVLASDGTTKLAELHEDFTSSASRLQYPGETTDYEWAVSAITDGAPRTAFFMGTMKELAFEDAKTGKIYSKEAFVPDTRVSSPLEVSYKIKLTYLDDGAYFGLGTGMASAAAALDGSNLIYFKRTALSTQIGLLKNGTEHQNTVISQTLAINDDTVILYSFRYAGGAYDVDIYFNGVWAGALTGVNINGHYGVGVISDGTAAVSLLLDDLTTRASRYADQSYSADIGVTETIDFKGTRERVAGTETFVTPYYNTSKWFASGNGVLPPRNTDPLDKQSLEFNITAGAANVVAAFGPTKTYADYVLRYTFKVTDADSGWLGISLARPSLEAQISA
ncbi:MAG: hypothetical protein LBS99_03465, partial [Clostridiales bacterium]|nr:hypothetical protein [Clostridiales bacterium]